MQQHTLKKQKGSTKKQKRLGRGNSSKRGTYCGRGVKGQSARSGGRRRPGFEGGQTPLIRRMPKLKGFKNINRINYQVVNIGKLNEIFKASDEITPSLLYQKRLISKKDQPVKILGTGELDKKLTIKAHKFSKSAESKIKKSKGTIEEIDKKVNPNKNSINTH